jgi:hypothetical protein
MPFWKWVRGLLQPGFPDSRYNIPYEESLVQDMFIANNPIPQDLSLVLPVVNIPSSISDQINDGLTCSQCAIIDRGPYLKGMGDTIDSNYDCWFRFDDQMPRKDQYCDVGSRTTFLMFDGEYRTNLSKAFNKKAITNTSILYYEYANPNQLGDRVHLLNRNAFSMPTPFFEKIKYDNSWGLMWFDNLSLKAVGLALSQCQTVDLYGFDAGDNSLSQHNYLGELAYYLVLQEYFPERFLMPGLPPAIRRIGNGVLHREPDWLILSH